VSFVSFVVRPFAVLLAALNAFPRGLPMCRIALLLPLLAAVLYGCTAGPAGRPSAAAVAFREIQREEDVYRIGMRWRGAAPADLEERMLLRCAEVARREGARYFFLVNADFDVTNEAYLKEGSVLTPVFRVPEEEEAARPPPPRTSATVTVKLFRAGQEPSGYRLYDAEKVLRRHVTLREARVEPEAMR
jgi:hypothetical protein